jgi:hypothetical protein
MRGPTLRGALPLAAALLLAPAPAAALHALPDEGSCYDCHTLNAGDSDPETSAINSVFGTLGQMRVANGGRAPERFGCTYCHSGTPRARMRPVLDDFLLPRPSRHPLGVRFAGERPGKTQNEFLSTVGSSTEGELDCVDCHDETLLAPALPDSYLGHVPPEDPARAANPLMLRGVTVPGEHDDHCRLCHANAGARVKGRELRLAAHADAGPGGPILESDGTRLKTTAAGGNRQCAACHGTHSSNLVRLLNDGHGGGAAVVGANCTQICHFPGDEGGYVDERDNAFTRRGHGRPKSTYPYKGGLVNPAGTPKAMGMTCGSCHVALDTGTVGPARKPHVECAPPGATPAERYQRRFNISLPVQNESGGSLFGNPVLGVCEGCHASYDGHRGGGGAVGCLDCHDEHAERSGRANLFMIPVLSKRTGSWGPAARERAGTKVVIYTVPARDPATGGPADGDLEFYRARDAGGICDSAECHPGAAPLEEFMRGGKHPGGDQDAGADCTKCHRHTGNSSSWSSK